jgi:hypothetical protein
MKVRRSLFDKSCAVRSFPAQALGVHAQMRLKISRRNSK